MSIKLYWKYHNIFLGCLMFFFLPGTAVTQLKMISYTNSWSFSFYFFCDRSPCLANGNSSSKWPVLIYRLLILTRQTGFHLPFVPLWPSDVLSWTTFRVVCASVLCNTNPWNVDSIRDFIINMYVQLALAFFYISD